MFPDVYWFTDEDMCRVFGKNRGFHYRGVITYNLPITYFNSDFEIILNLKYKKYLFGTLLHEILHGIFIWFRIDSFNYLLDKFDAFFSLEWLIDIIVHLVHLD